MTARNLNGASVHAERPMPDATLCWLSALDDRRAQLRTDLLSLELQARGTEKLEEMRRSLVRLAEDVATADGADLERLRDQLNEFDARTEQLLAESNGRVKRLRAQLSHRQNPVAKAGLPATAEDVATLEAELRDAERADGQLLGRRLAEREPIRRAWLSSARNGLVAGLQLLALAEADLPALMAAGERAAAVRDELETLDCFHERTNRGPTN